MLLAIPDLLGATEVALCRSRLAQAEWVDGRVTAGHQSALAKKNRQVIEGSAVARELGELVLKALQRSALFMSAALPEKIFPPLFNAYAGGEHFGTHVDGAIRPLGDGSVRIRTDLSATLFLSAPETYEGGELCIEDTYGLRKVKLPAGHLLLYPATSLHQVTPVTQGTRLASFFWIQSLVREDTDRSLLFDLDSAIRQLGGERPDHPVVVQLTGVYHNLLRKWAEL